MKNTIKAIYMISELICGWAVAKIGLGGGAGGQVGWDRLLFFQLKILKRTLCDRRTNGTDRQRDS